MALTSFPHISFTLEPIAAFANEAWHLGVATNENKSLEVEHSLTQYRKCLGNFNHSCMKKTTCLGSSRTAFLYQSASAARLRAGVRVEGSQLWSPVILNED